VQFAVCREAQGFPEEAARILDRLIAAHPGEANSYYHRGRLELARGNAKAALPLLRRSSDLNPSDPEVLYSLLLALREVGTAAEVREAQERLEQCNADLKRVAELARAISASPRDPDLRREMGELFLKNGREQEGISWLKSALRERIDHRPTHLLLAEHYDRAGDQNLAAYHRKFVGP
jgi:predicted Zn-dependent protease